jgi:hypothetical protein
VDPSATICFSLADHLGRPWPTVQFIPIFTTIPGIKKTFFVFAGNNWPKLKLQLFGAQ